MKARAAVTILLVLFVALSATYLIYRETHTRSTAGRPADGTDADAASVASASRDSEVGDKIIAYYFHGTTRCPTCRTIEAYAEEAIRTGYPNELASGRLEWHAVNIEEPTNEHFVRDFNLVTRSVVLVHVEDGVRKEWRNLDKVWNLVRDKEAFLNYMYENANGFIGEVETNG
jgi:hypothetical protein